MTGVRNLDNRDQSVSGRVRAEARHLTYGGHLFSWSSVMMVIFGAGFSASVSS